MNEIVLTDEQYTIIGQFHNSTAGHAGIDRTIKRLHHAGISWPYLRELVRAYIRMCPVYQKMSYLKVPTIARRFTATAAGLMEVVNMDYEGPFPEISRTVGVVCWTKSWDASCGPYVVGTAHWYICCPSQIVSDRGTHFTADIIRALMVLLGSNHELTLAASKQENTAVENANKWSQEYLRSMLFGNRTLKRWSDVLPLVQRIMISEPNEVIGVSPAQLLFGNSIQLDRGICLPNLPRGEWKRRSPFRIGLIRYLKRSVFSLIRHNDGYNNRRMLDIWRQAQVLLHALTSAPVSWSLIIFKRWMQNRLQSCIRDWRDRIWWLMCKVRWDRRLSCHKTTQISLRWALCWSSRQT